MPDQDSHSEPVLKVSDRRHFTAEGQRRPDVEAAVFEESAPPPPPPPKPGPEKEKPKIAVAAEKDKGKKPAPARAERLAAREINFAGLVQDLFATGMMQLGAELQPGQPGQLDLEGARETIDLLGLLQQKTHGNLDDREERLLNSVLYELRMAYVEVQRAATSVPLPPPPRRR